ncbi:MAG: dTDP-4-dehydrorhamnose 3,5-epimerase [Fibrobacter sp.]|nr:dTDP-4-dehydrorhamnose 3,5-epimerase [Fibrobacter sp.]
MEFIKTDFEGLYLIKPAVFKDNRGFFMEFYAKEKFADAGIDACFVQDNHSKSMSVGVVRGLHFQDPPFSQAKLVRVTKGAVYDVVVDLRKNSPTFGKWTGFELTEENFMMMFIPRGFAHGFCTLVPDTEFQYKVDNPYSAAHDRGIRWDDSDIGVNWPVSEPVISKKDSNLPYLREIVSPF